MSKVIVHCEHCRAEIEVELDGGSFCSADCEWASADYDEFIVDDVWDEWEFVNGIEDEGRLAVYF